MKTGKALLSITFLSLSVYRFSQVFLVQQVQKVTAATVEVDKKAADESITGDEINITVKNYPTKTTTPDPDPNGKPDPGPSTDTEKPGTSEDPTTSHNQQPASKLGDLNIQANQTPVFSVPLADLLQTTPNQKTASLVVATQPTITDKQPARAPKDQTVGQSAPGLPNDVGGVTAQDTKHKHQKHDAQVEKDIVAFQSSSGNPAPGGGGAATQVGVVFGELAGRSLFAVR
ncbi:hypothetical protein [Latilactobacillus graminis]|uniref:Uncharacterized protein n=2 Tax=Latilactobacillus graminis TaxID=60519 RepID=A0AA89I169_9LACO|nr:hypothetical protein [Latilactobacillus graminis]KRM23369.1 hypothetical protein FC90_GL000323 [Latilactobacillus graminis DSM 20719]QFP80280.1 hypothetical protein LG542_08665 [Latilactobacillus graminis]